MVDQPPGKCVCPNCKYTMDAPKGIMCPFIKCPKCGNSMIKSETVVYPLE